MCRFEGNILCRKHNVAFEMKLSYYFKLPEGVYAVKITEKRSTTAKCSA